MLKAVLFDLDGTLLLSNEEEFYSAYFKVLGDYCKDLINPFRLVDRVQQIIKKITLDNGNTTNYDKFMEEMKKEMGNYLAEKLEKRFNSFYLTAFNELKSLTVPNVYLIQWMRSLKVKRVLATNPIFPKIAIVKRMEWAGLSEEEFSLVTVMEDSHYLKPRGEYYTEITQKLGVEPQECVMIGNDPILDGACTKIGMRFKHVNEITKN